MQHPRPLQVLGSAGWMLALIIRFVLLLCNVHCSGVGGGEVWCRWQHVHCVSTHEHIPLLCAREWGFGEWMNMPRKRKRGGGNAPASKRRKQDDNDDVGSAQLTSETERSGEAEMSLRRSMRIASTMGEEDVQGVSGSSSRDSLTDFLLPSCSHVHGKLNAKAVSNHILRSARWACESTERRS